MYKPILGECLRIEFDDHAFYSAGEEGLIRIICIGQVRSITKDYIHLDCFFYKDGNTNDNDGYSIARSCIKTIKRLR